MNIKEFRQQYPQYNMLDDTDLANRLYQKHYADKISYPDFAQRFGAGGRSFFDKVGESWRRSGESLSMDLAAYEAINSGDMDAFEGVVRADTKRKRGEALDPIEGNFFSNFVYKSAATANYMVTNMKRAFTKGLRGAAEGAGMAAVAGALGPQAAIPEEVVTVPAAAAIGFKVRSTMESALFSYRQGTGRMYLEMRHAGVPHETAVKAASVGGIPYSLIEAVQIGQLLPNVKKAAQQSILHNSMKAVAKNFAKNYTGRYLAVVGEEGLQEIVQVATEDIGRKMAGQDIPIDMEYLKDRGARVFEALKEAAQGMALINVPGTAIETAYAHSLYQSELEMEQAKKAVEEGAKTRLTWQDVSNPKLRVQLVLEEAQGLLPVQEERRHQERVERVGEAGTMRGEFTGEEAIARAKAELRGEYAQERITPLREALTEERTPETQPETQPRTTPPVGQSPVRVAQDLLHIDQRDADPGVAQSQAWQERAQQNAVVTEELSVPRIEYDPNITWKEQLNKIRDAWIEKINNATTLSTDEKVLWSAVLKELPSYFFEIPGMKVQVGGKPTVATKEGYVVGGGVDLGNTVTPQLIIKLFQTREPTDFIHEYGHAFLSWVTTEKQHEKILKLWKEAAGQKYEDAKKKNDAYGMYYNSYHEWFARRFHDYLVSRLSKKDAKFNDALTKAFNGFTELLTRIWRSIKGQSNVPLAQFFDDIFSEKGWRGGSRLAKQPFRQSTEVLNALGQQLYHTEHTDIRTVANEAVKQEVDIKPDIAEETYLALLEELRTSKLRDFEWINAADGFRALFNEGKIPANHILQLFEKVGWFEMAQTIRALRDAGKTDLSDVLNLPRTLSATGDLSRLLRQNILTVGKPKQFLKAWARDMTAFANNNPDAVQLTERKRWSSHSGQMGLAAGLRRNNLDATATYHTGTEAFASRLAKRLPLVRRAALAYTHGGNMLRLDLWDQVYEANRGAGLTHKQWSDLAHVINLITGEGDPRAFGSWASSLNAIFFAPRLFHSRVMSVAELANPQLSGIARRYLAAQMAKFVGVNLGVLTTLSLTFPGSVEWDRRSTDFLKIKHGKTRIDFWGGYLPLVRTVIRLVEGKRKTQAGEVVDVETIDTITAFLQSKLGPVPASVIDLLKGETFLGDEVDWRNPDHVTKMFYERFTPFFIQDIIEAGRHEGVAGVAIAAPTAFFGGGVSTYDLTPQARLMMKLNQYAGEATGQKWTDLGPEAQKYIKTLYPQIEYEERAVRYEMSQSKRRNMNFLKEQQETAKRIKGNLPKDVQMELDKLQITTGFGIGNQINEWKLNKARFAEYERMVTEGYKKVLPTIINSEVWNRTPEEVKLEVLNDVFTRVKKAAREQIIIKANMEDFEKLR